MKTPYDTALRLAERKVDKIRAAIGEAVRDLQHAEALQVAAARALEHECLLAASDPRLTTEHFFVRARDQRLRLGLQRGAEQAKLESLRAMAVESYAALQAMEGAVVRFHEAADHDAALAEQAAIDDLTTGRYVRKAARRRRDTARGAATQGAVVARPANESTA